VSAGIAKTRYVLLDGLRGVAAIGVMSFHLWLGGFRILQGFNIFVDFFFVLSGFVLAPKVLDSSKGSTKRFIYGRILRLYPMLVPIFIALLLTQKFPLISDDFNNKPQLNLTQYLSAFLLLQVFWGTLIQLNPPLWSLSAEWFMNLFAIFFRSMKIFLPMVFLGVIAQGLGIYLDHKYQLNWGVIKYTIGLGRVMVGFYLGIILRQRITRKPRTSSTKNWQSRF
jgi:peptidoglycan/LPS O-acetylase OafA/YrhL